VGFGPREILDMVSEPWPKFNSQVAFKGVVGVILIFH